MTADDLRIQKALAQLDAKEAKEASVKADEEFKNMLRLMSAAANMLRDSKFSEPTQVRNGLADYANVVNVDAVVASWQRMFDAKQAETDADRKQNVFRS